MVESQSMGSPRKKKILKRKAQSASPLLNKSAKLSPTRESDANDMPLQKNSADSQKTEHEVKFEGQSLEAIGSRYPVLKNEELVQKFLSVTLTNNQKGRIRQLLKDNLKGTSSILLPDVIHNRILSILKGSTNLNDTELRKIRILYNMLKTAIAAEKQDVEKKTSEKKAVEKKKKQKKLAKESSKEVTDNVNEPKQMEKKEPKEQLVKKVKGKKRYVVFLGNLPLGVNKDMIMQHFSEMNEHIIDIRIPKPKEDKKSAIAYVELRNEPTYELALSKHHSMMGSKRIRVLYTTQKNGKITKGEAKSKSAKLLALQKSGMLIGSTPLNRKRSQRRLKQKKARAKQEGHSV